jgi:hypothetical protein
MLKIVNNILNIIYNCYIYISTNHTIKKTIIYFINYFRMIKNIDI